MRIAGNPFMFDRPGGTTHRDDVDLKGETRPEAVSDTMDIVNDKFAGDSKAGLVTCRYYSKLELYYNQHVEHVDCSWQNM